MNKPTTKTITQQYARDAERPELLAVKHALRISGNFGFPVTSLLGHRNSADQIVLAAKFLLSITPTCRPEDIPEGFYPEPESQLHIDAEQLRAIATSAHRTELAVSAPWSRNSATGRHTHKAGAQGHTNPGRR